MSYYNFDDNLDDFDSDSESDDNAENGCEQPVKVAATKQPESESLETVKGVKKKKISQGLHILNQKHNNSLYTNI